MKKHSAMFLTFSALLTVNAFAPQMFWDAKLTNGRFPSSVEDPSILCNKESEETKLEAEVKKLLEDKESILKELEELKKAKKEDKKEDDKKEVVKQDHNSQILDIMSQLTSLMISQQQQQQMMMEQMFSMMAMPQQRPLYNSFSSPVAEYVSPYAYIHENFAQPAYYPYASSSQGWGQGIGIGLAAQQPSMGMQPGGFGYNPEEFNHQSGFGRVPSQDNRYETIFSEPLFITPEMNRMAF